MNYTFLLINLGLLLIPFLFAIDKNNFGLAQIGKALLPSFLVSIIFSGLALLLTVLLVWQFNGIYVMGINYQTYPIEQSLFFFSFSFAGLSIYQYLNEKFPNNKLQQFSLTASNLVLGVCVAILFFAYGKWYTATTFGILFGFLLYVEYVNKLRFMYRFYRAYAASLIPFAVCYGLIVSLPITTYLPAETLKMNVANIPMENFFLIMAMLLMAVYFLEWFKAKKQSA